MSKPNRPSHKKGNRETRRKFQSLLPRSMFTPHRNTGERKLHACLGFTWNILPPSSARPCKLASRTFFPDHSFCPVALSRANAHLSPFCLPFPPFARCNFTPNGAWSLLGRLESEKVRTPKKRNLANQVFAFCVLRGTGSCSALPLVTVPQRFTADMGQKENESVDVFECKRSGGKKK